MHSIRISLSVNEYTILDIPDLLIIKFKSYPLVIFLTLIAISHHAEQLKYGATDHLNAQRFNY